MKHATKSHRLWTRRLQSNQHGFTIIELMIALSIISVILVISTVVLISLGSLYTKGNNQANTQNMTRNITNELASELELGSADPQFGANVICIGSQRYTFALNHQLVTNTDHALWRDTMKGGGACAAADLTQPDPDSAGSTAAGIAGSGTELLAPQMQLTDFSVSQTTGGTYSITVTVTYGDPTLLVTTNGKPHCTGDKGTEYCAVSSLTENVARRGQN